MKYNIIINQKAVVDNGWTNIKANHIAILEVINSFVTSPNCIKINDEKGLWFWINTKLIIKEIPMFDIKERRCRDLLNDLSEVNLIEINPNNKKLGRSYIRLGKSIDLYYFERGVQKNAEVCNKLHTPNAINCIPPMQNIADDNNTIHNSTNDNEKETKVLKAKSIDFAKLLGFIKEQTKREFRVVNDATKKKYKARLKEGYKKEDIINSIKNACSTEFHKNNNYQYLTPDFFSRSSTLEKYSTVSDKIAIDEAKKSDRGALKLKGGKHTNL